MANRIDSRDLYDRFHELERNWDYSLNTGLLEEERTEMNEIAEILSELDENCDNDAMDGIQMIPKNDWKEYAMEYADDTGALSGYKREKGPWGQVEEVDILAQWPFSHIDWNEAARDLAEDWYECEFRGVTYLCR